METRYKMIQGRDFIRFNALGITDLEQSKKALLELALMAGLSQDCEILMDVREAYGGFKEKDVQELVLELGKHHQLFHSKIAILTRDDEQFHKAILAEILSTIDGYKVQAFTEFEQAINWLNSTETIEDLF
jgi:hypothetical protein